MTISNSLSTPVASQATTVVSTSTAVSSKPATAKSSAPATGSDTVQLSSAAQAALAAMKEVTETVAQTSKEAAGGDHQAQQLLARELASKVAE